MKGSFLFLTFFAATTALAFDARMSKTYEQADDTFWAKNHISTNNAVIGIVEKISGDCFIRRKGKSGKESASMGFHLFEGDTAFTQEGRMHLRYKDGTFVELGEDSSFQSERVRLKFAHKDESVFRFSHGVARVVNFEAGSANKFTLKTTNAILRVKDASEFFLVQPDEVRDLTVAFYRGSARLMCAVTNQTVDLTPGRAAYLKVAGFALQAGVLNNELIAFLKSRTRMQANF